VTLKHILSPLKSKKCTQITHALFLASNSFFYNFSLSEIHSLNLKLFSKQYYKRIVLHLIVVPQLSSGWRHNYSTKTWKAGWANKQSVYFSYVYGGTTINSIGSVLSFVPQGDQGK
jgi:hypothetical protein